MAYMNQEKKQAIAPQVKAILKQYGMKGTLSVDHHSTLVLTLTEGPLDIVANYIAKAKPEHDTNGRHHVNQYWIADHYTGEVLEFLQAIKAAMDGEGCDFKNHDRSDLYTDYHDVGWYVDINVGRWNKPYKLAA